MDERTAELRDIFVDATGSDTVTERQEADRGSLAGDDAATGRRLRELIATMRDRVGFETSLDDGVLALVARGFFAEDVTDDAALADWVVERAGAGDEADGAGEDRADAATVPDGFDAADALAARLDLHLVRPADRATDAYEPVRAVLVRDGDAPDDPAALAEAAGVDAAPDAVARTRRVVEADVASTRASDRYRDEFEELLTDAELSGRLARDAREDGLREATEDMETDVSF